MKIQQVTMWASRFSARSRARSVCLALAVTAAIYHLVILEISPPLGAATLAKPGSAPHGRSSAAESYGRLPLSFEPNRGQTDPLVKFLSRGRGYQIFLTPTETVLSLRKAAGNSKFENRKSAPELSTHRPAADMLRMKLVGASATMKLEGDEKLPGISNYFIGKDPAQWRTSIPNYRRVIARQVYPGVDLVYYGQGRQLEYDFVVAPGADHRAIRFALEVERRNLKIDANGDLVVSLEGGEVRFHKPVVYQDKLAVGSRQSTEEEPGAGSNRRSSIGNRQFIEGRYVLLAANPKSKIPNPKLEVGFEIDAYDNSRPLIIDPVLSYSTYLGGSNIDSARGIATDSLGSAYVVGQTDSANFPTAHALQPNRGGGLDFPDDLFVSKLSADGSTLVYSTYLGGNSREYAGGIAVDQFGAAYITGTTLSTDYPTTHNAFKPTCGIGPNADCDQSNGRFLTDAVITKLNPAGSELEYSSYYSAPTGTAEHEQGLAIAVGADLRAYVTGSTTFNDYDVFVFRVDPTGSNLGYNTGFGGSGKDLGQGIAVDAAGNALITGYTSSPDFPVVNGLPPGLLGVADGFVTRITPTAGVDYSTYLGGDAGSGGAGVDQGNAIAVDIQGTAGIAYVTGMTTSRAAMLGFAVPGAPVQPDCALNGLGNCDGDAFVAKVDTNQAGAASLLYFTYHGGGNAESGNGIAVDPSGNAYVTGSTNSTDLPAVAGAFQPSYGGGNTDAFVTKFSPDASARVYSSFLGGTGADAGYGIATDQFENAFVTGETCSTNFPISRPYQAASAGNCDAFVAKVLVGPDLRLSDAALNFGNQAVGTASAPQTITLTSSGDAALTINNIFVSAGAADFILIQTCPGALAVAGNCEIEVTFTPSAIGPRTGTITVDTDAPGGPHFINLQGTGGTFGVSPLQVVFGDQAVGTTSGALPVTITNSGGAAVTIFGIDASGDFAQNNNCGNNLATGVCTINVTFTPTATGTRTGTLTIADSDATSPQVVTLSGHGTAPVAALSPTNLAFPNQGVTGLPQAVTLTNNGNAPLTISGITVSGPFSQINTCTGSVLAGASCQINVSFNPVAPGAATGQLTITDDAAGSPQTVALSGNGQIPVVSLNPGSLGFGDLIITNPASSSDPQTIILSNTGNATLNIDLANTVVMGVNATDFALTNNCPAALLAAESCALSVIFTPGAAGTRLALLVITDDAPASPQNIALTGVGVLAPAVSLSTSSLTFPATAQGATSAPQNVTLTNIGSAELLVSGISISANFTTSSACSAGIAPGATCVISVTFAPQTSGNLFGTLSITDNAAGSPHVVQLAGNALPVPNVSLIPVALTFGDQAVNTTSGAQTVNLTNTGGAPLAITSASIAGTNGGDFGISSNSCTGTFAPGTGCAVSVVFAPSAAGARVANLVFVDDALDSPQSIPLAGNGVLPAGIAFNPTSLPFPSAPVGTPSAPQTVTLTNTGGGTLNLNSMVITGAHASDFALNHNCGATVAPGLNCTLSVIFTPSADGSRQANITVTDNAPGSPHTVPLFGAGSTAAGNFTLAATPASGRVFAGDGATFTVTVTPLNGFNAQVNLTCSENISLGSCSISPNQVAPDGTNPVTAQLTVTTTARVMAPPAPGPGDFFPRHGWRWVPWLAALMALAMMVTARRKRAVLLLAAMMATLVFWTACGAGGSVVNVPTGTPVGNYTITVTATSGSTTQNTAVSLTVD